MLDRNYILNSLVYEIIEKYAEEIGVDHINYIKENTEDIIDFAIAWSYRLTNATIESVEMGDERATKNFIFLLRQLVVIHKALKTPGYGIDTTIFLTDTAMAGAVFASHSNYVLEEKIILKACEIAERMNTEWSVKASRMRREIIEQSKYMHEKLPYSKREDFYRIIIKDSPTAEEIDTILRNLK